MSHSSHSSHSSYAQKLVFGALVFCASIFTISTFTMSAYAATPQSLVEMVNAPIVPVALDTSDAPSKQASGVGNGIAKLAPELMLKLTGHPSLNEARENVCSARYRIGLNRSQYFPQISASLSGGEKIINKTTRSDDLGGTDSPEYDGKGVNATLSVRQKIYDWGDTSAAVGTARSERNRALLERMRVLDEQTAALLRAALDYVSQDTSVALMQADIGALEQTILSAEARFKAGASRMSEVREAQIIRIEQQSAIDIAAQRRRQSQQVLKVQFGVTPKQARQFVAEFLKRRPRNPQTIPPEATLDGRVIGLEIRILGFERKRLGAQRLPALDGVLIGRAWDIDKSNACGDIIFAGHPDFDDGRSRGFGVAGNTRYSNCNTHEVSASLEINMPLFDGGANKAQRRDIAARLRGIEARRLAHARSHESGVAYLQAQLQEYQNRLSDMRAQTGKLQGQLDSLLALQGKTQSDPVSLARVQTRTLNAKSQVVLLTYQLENLRLELLLRANALATTLGIELEKTGC